ncbi:Hypothetical protein NTJ_10737 [Nesidiocoris tenuis]|nr:Hypothetical protein NTJ_10737 [Nesidiocoris tenuis]
MMRDYLIDRHAAICAFTIYVVSFLIYAYAINKFHTAERIRELRRVVVAIDRLFSATERRRGTSISDQSQSVSLKNSSSEPTPHEPQVDSSRS